MDYTIEQLKAMAYDELLKANTAQQNIAAIQQAINDKLKATSVKKTEVQDVAEIELKEKKKK